MLFFGHFEGYVEDAVEQLIFAGQSTQSLLEAYSDIEGSPEFKGLNSFTYDMLTVLDPFSTNSPLFLPYRLLYEVSIVDTSET